MGEMSREKVRPCGVVGISGSVAERLQEIRRSAHQYHDVGSLLLDFRTERLKWCVFQVFVGSVRSGSNHDLDGISTESIVLLLQQTRRGRVRQVYRR